MRQEALKHILSFSGNDEAVAYMLNDRHSFLISKLCQCLDEEDAVKTLINVTSNDAYTDQNGQ